MNDKRSSSLYKKVSCLAIGIVAAMVTYYLASPLFISTELNEPFPLNTATSISYDKFNNMTEVERAKAAENMS